ncbi:MAG TPA: glycosyl transferase, partial [Ramlibacter sp.]|nr:glycosyl transferase [Ramlibacter sp.]
MLFLLILCCGSAFLATALVVRYGRAHSRRYAWTMPQRFHAGHVPRLGGVGMLVACTVGWAWMAVSQRLDLNNQLRIDFGTAGA